MLYISILKQHHHQISRTDKLPDQNSSTFHRHHQTDVFSQTVSHPCWGPCLP